MDFAWRNSVDIHGETAFRTVDKNAGSSGSMGVKLIESAFWSDARG